MRYGPSTIMTVTPILVTAVFVVLFVLERFRPLRRASRRELPRWVVNAMVVLIALGVAAVTVAPAAHGTVRWAQENRFGLLRLISLPAPLAFVVGFLLMDLTFYYWHRLNHRLPWLWRFHNVHHIDPDLDSTTSLRFHFGEIAYSAVFRALQVGLIGVSLSTYAYYEMTFLCATLFHHGNVRLPIGLERALNRVIVTPRMHGIHHSVVREETNSNYSVVFRWWDSLHRTLELNIPQSRVEIGVPGYASPDDNKLWRALTMPFVKQREYWRTPDDNIPTRAEGELDQHTNRLAQ